MRRVLHAVHVLVLLAACAPAAPALTPSAVPAAAPAPAAAPPTVAAAPPTAVPIAPPIAPPTAAAPTPTATPAPATVLVGDTGGEGVFIRRAPDPAPGARIRAWPDGTRLTTLGERVQAAGTAWERVRDPDGTTGYVAAQYLKPEAPRR